MDEVGDITLSLSSEELLQHDIPIQYDAHAGCYAKISVVDTGCGMGEEVLDKIFDLFFTTKPVDIGTGVGLSTVQGVVKDHSGLIKVNSTLGEGTTFELYFPIEDSNIEPLESPIVDDSQPTGTERILLVDDDELVAALGEKILAEVGYHVTTLTQSQEALTVFAGNAENFDLIITDQTMPNLTGEELIRAIKQIRPDIPTIICTGYSSKVDEEDAKTLGANAFLMKPLDLTVLVQTVRQVLDA